MPNYQNGKIYKIHSYRTDDIYIGSTTNTLSRRFSGHKSKNVIGYGTKSYIILEYDDAMITLIENYPCNDKYELEKRERYHIENNNCVNKHIPTRTDKEYYEDNKDKIKQYHKIYNTVNRDKRIKLQTIYNDANKDKFKQYRFDNKDRLKQHRFDNKDRIKQVKKQYYIKNINNKKIYDCHRNSHFGIICKSYGIFD